LITKYSDRFIIRQGRFIIRQGFFCLCWTSRKNIYSCRPRKSGFHLASGCK